MSSLEQQTKGQSEARAEASAVTASDGSALRDRLAMRWQVNPMLATR